MKDVSLNGLGDRVKAARQDAGLSQADLARRVGISQASLAALEKGATRNPKHLVQLANALGLDPTWLLTGTGRAIAGVAFTSHNIFEVGGKEYTSIQRYDASVSAGAGSIIDEHAESLGGHLVETQWLRALTLAAPDYLCILRCAGDSMVDTLCDGDWVLVDRSQTRFSREGIYTLQFEDFVWIKRLQIDVGTKMVKIISDNSRYGEQQLPADQVRIIGRAIAVVARKL